MLVAETTLSDGEIHHFLNEDGYAEGTEAYFQERNRRYYVVTDQTPLDSFVRIWAERPCWNGDRIQCSRE